jgi:hypothetical protein
MYKRTITVLLFKCTTCAETSTTDRAMLLFYRCVSETKHDDIQGVPGGKDNILGGHSIGHSKQKNFICTCVLFRTVSEIEPF